ncbi:MAG: septum formation protein Maf [Chlamydiia bacterium]|nr:septum formation protein Maf [Chlamydiia bacterium]
MRLILGSQSPQRKAILSYYALQFEQATSYFEEERVPFEGDPIKYVTTLSKGKAKALAPQFPDAIILTADTVVFKEGKIFNKPATEEENFSMLQELNGSWHSVFTAVTALRGEIEATDFAETRVQFHSIEERELRLYHRAFNGLDKSGGYSIQKGGSLIVKRMEGCFYNVVGLPPFTLQKVLKEVGLNLWEHLSLPSSAS